MEIVSGSLWCWEINNSNNTRVGEILGEEMGWRKWSMYRHDGGVS